MADQGILLLLSGRDYDNALFHDVAQRCGFEFRSCNTATDFLKLFASNPTAQVIWDADHPDGGLDTHPYAHKSVKFILFKAIPPQRVFALTDQPINLYPEDPKFPFLVRYAQHNIIRRNHPRAVAMYARVFQQFNVNKFGELAGYIDGTPVAQRIEIQKASQRAPAVDAMQNFLSKANIDNRLAAKIAQATDELLMNAIFDAPMDDEGLQMRHLLSRTTQFDLEPSKRVHLEALMGDEACGICVTDFYGSVSQEKVLESLKQNYKNTDYQIRNNTVSAGLGLYNIVQSGVSFILSYTPRVKTTAMIFFPRVNSHKGFRESFQLTAVVKQ